MIDAEQSRATVSPAPLAADLRSATDRDLPSRTDPIGAGLSELVGGPVGRHALIGRTRLLTPLRVMFIIALVFLALGWSTKAPCLQTTGTGPPDKRVANWQNQRAYYELCYSDTVPLYGAHASTKACSVKPRMDKIEIAGDSRSVGQGRAAVVKAGPIWRMRG